MQSNQPPAWLAPWGKPAAAALKAAIIARVPVLLWGAPGIGKTVVLATIAKAVGAHLEVLIGSTMDPTDLGFMAPDGDGGLNVLPPPWAVRLRRALDAGQETWLFFDELTCAPPAVQAALLRVTQEKQVAGIGIEDCCIIAAANPTDQAAGAAAELSAATANRWTHISVVPDVAAFCAGLRENWGKPQSPAQAVARGLVASYLHRRPAALLQPPKDLTAAGGPWASPRSWDNLTRVIAALATAPTYPAIVDAARSDAGAILTDGLIGHGAAAEWSAWIRTADLPDPEDLLAGRVKIPARGDLIVAVLDALVTAALVEHADKAGRVRKAAEILSEVTPADVAIPAAGRLAKGLTPEERRNLPPAVKRLADVIAAAKGAS